MGQEIPLWNSLEVVKLAVSLITPVVVILLGIWVSRLTRRMESLQWARRTVIEKRIQVYDEVSSRLNNIFCFFTLVGNWKDLTPPEIVSLKRYLDRKLHIASPFFSKDLKLSYDSFMNSCYETHREFGHDALLKATKNAYRKTAGDKWDPDWDSLFIEDMSGAKGAAQREATKRSYEELINAFARELGLGVEERQIHSSFSRSKISHNKANSADVKSRAAD